MEDVLWELVEAEATLPLGMGRWESAGGPSGVRNESHSWTVVNKTVSTPVGHVEKNSPSSIWVLPALLAPKRRIDRLCGSYSVRLRDGHVGLQG